MTGVIVLLRFLALAHFGWAIVLLLISAYFGSGMLRTLAHLSSGDAGTTLLQFLFLAAVHTLPFAVLGLWMIVLGWRAWTMHPRLRRTLLVSHGILLLPGTLAVYAGVHATRAAEISTARGGGLLSPLAMLPLVFGVPVLVLALCSITIAMTRLSPRKEPGRDHH